MKQFILIFTLFFFFTAEAKTNINFWETHNGVRVYFIESLELPIVDINVNFDAGSARDNPKKSGVSNLTNYLMMLGSANLNENQLSDSFSDIGATIGGGVDPDHAKITLRSLSKKETLNQALKTFQLVLSSPRFDKTVFDREKLSTLSLIEQSQTQPDSIGANAFKKLLYGDHPYAFPEEGLLETVRGLKQSDVIDFYKQFYTAQNASIVIVGDLNKNEAQDISDQLTRHLKEGKNPEISDVQSISSGENLIENSAQQAHLFYGMPTLERQDQDFFPLYVGNYILGGGGFVSRLTGEVREKNGLVYSVYSYFMPMTKAGPFQIGLQTKKDQIDDAFSLVKKVVSEFVQNGPSQKELEDAKKNLIGGFPLRLDSNKKITEYISMMAVYNYPLDYLETFSQKVESVTIDQIKDAFKRRIDMSKFSTVIVGKK